MNQPTNQTDIQLIEIKETDIKDWKTINITDYITFSEHWWRPWSQAIWGCNLSLYYHGLTKKIPQWLVFGTTTISVLDDISISKNNKDQLIKVVDLLITEAKEDIIKAVGDLFDKELSCLPMERQTYDEEEKVWWPSKDMVLIRNRFIRKLSKYEDDDYFYIPITRIKIGNYSRPQPSTVETVKRMKSCK